MGKTRNWQKSAFPILGKQKISKKQLSQHWENKKLAKNGFPNIGKNKKCHWLHFPTLGKTKNPESLLSDFRGSVHFDTSSFLIITLQTDGKTLFFYAHILDVSLTHSHEQALFPLAVKQAMNEDMRQRNTQRDAQDDE